MAFSQREIRNSYFCSMRFFASLLILWLLTGCAEPAHQQASPGLVALLAGSPPKYSAHRYSEEYAEFYNNMMAQPNPFTLPVSKSEDAWGRANVFVAKYSEFRVQSATNYTITTYYPDDESSHYGYSVTRSPMGDSVIFEIKCIGNDPISVNDNAKAAAYYIATGIIKPILITY